MRSGKSPPVKKKAAQTRPARGRGLVCVTRPHRVGIRLLHRRTERQQVDDLGGGAGGDGRSASGVALQRAGRAGHGRARRRGRGRRGRREGRRGGGIDCEYDLSSKTPHWHQEKALT